jgi:AcrR family transcriptional regulator
MKSIDPDQHAAPRRGRGRPRAFDPDMALENAMRLFWERGYEAASMDELTETMGLSPSSAYSAFGGKEQLFARALDRYMAGPGAFPMIILREPGPARAAFARLFAVVAREYTCADRPTGCMVAAAGSQSSPAAAEVRAALAERRREAVAAYEDRLRRARRAAPGRRCRCAGPFLVHGCPGHVGAGPRRGRGDRAQGDRPRGHACMAPRVSHKSAIDRDASLAKRNQTRIWRNEPNRVRCETGARDGGR